MMQPEALLLLPRLRVQNVNAISSPLTWGFPSPSAFTGFVHSLHRRVSDDLDLALDGVAIVCHHFEAQASTPAGRRTKVFHLTRNPVDKSGGAAAIVEEGRAHMTVSLLIGVSGDGVFSGTQPAELAGAILEVAASMRLAGGSILPHKAQTKHYTAELAIWSHTEQNERRLSNRLARKLLPGFALVSRESLLEQHWGDLQRIDPGATSLEALLDLSGINYEPPEVPTPDDHGGSSASARAQMGERNKWTVRRKQGWLVPVAAGYRAISDLYAPGEVKNTRDRTTPFRFVEGIYTLGQWISPHRVDDVRKLLWVHASDPDAGIYRCTTPNFSSTPSKEGN